MASGITNTDKVSFRVGNGAPTNPPAGSINFDENSGAMYIAGSSGTVQVKDTTKAPTSHASASTGFGVSTAVNYGHAKASSTTPKAPGTASAGSETGSFARGDHVHPAQTDISGNAATATTATKLGTADKGSATQPIYLDGGVPTACTYTLGKSVPSNAVFTDTVYSLPNATSSTLGGVKVGSNITVSSGTISLTKTNVTNALGYTPPTTNTTYSVMTGATSSAAGTSGLTPAPAAGTANRYLRSDGTWTVPPDTNTHYTAKMVATNSATSTTDYISEEPIINNIWLNIVENNAVTSAKNIVADTGMVSVKLLNGKIRISGTQLASSNFNVNSPIYFAPDSNPSSSGDLSSRFISYNANITLNPSTGALNGVVIDGGDITVTEN